MNYLWAPLRFALWIVANLLCSSICLLDAIFELLVIDENNCSMTFLLESESKFYM